MRLDRLGQAAFAIILASPATAQDYTGIVDPSEWSRPTVMESTIDAQSRRNGRRTTANAVTPQQRAACSGLPRFRAQHGRDDPRVLKLTRLCRRHGL